MSEQVEFEFPDEKEAKAAAPEKEVSNEVEIEVVDDTPEKDRGREPSEPPAEVTDEEIEKYSESVQKRIKHLHKGFHDERRAKERAERERQEAVSFAEKIFRENKRLQDVANRFGDETTEALKQAAESELVQTRIKLKKAFEDGDPELLAAAQEEMADVKLKLARVNSVPKKALQVQEDTVYNQPIESKPRVDAKAKSWQNENTWFGANKEMTSFALGVHETLIDNGVDADSDEYYEKLNRRIRQVFPEAFEDEAVEEKPVKKAKPANVVAPATRSTAPKKIVLTQTQVAFAKRIGVPLEDYAKEIAKLGRENG
jgi:hypothetical protein